LTKVLKLSQTTAASARPWLPVYAQLHPGAAAAAAGGLGLGVGFTNTGAATGYFLKWGTVCGNFPYFALGAAATDDHYRALRDCSGAARAAGVGATLGAILAVFAGLSAGAVCFDEWQWEAWKSAPYVHYHLRRGGGVGGGGGGGGGGGAGEGGLGGGGLDVSLLAVAVLFRAATYVGATAAGLAFLAAVPRELAPRVSPLGARTMYGYLLHAPALLGILAAGGIFARAGIGAGLDAWEAVAAGVLLPVGVTAACMTRPAQACAWWLCEPRFGDWLWRPAGGGGGTGGVERRR